MKSFRKLIFYTISVTIIGLQIISSCTDNRTKIADTDIFIKVYAEILIIEKLQIENDQKAGLVKKALDKYNISSELFLATKDSLKRDPQFWIHVYQQTQNEIKRHLENSKKNQQ